MLSWASRKVQTDGGTPVGGLTSSQFIDETGGSRNCSGCQGDAGSCAGACAEIHIETNIGGSNWGNPDSWKMTSVNINIWFTIG